MAKEEKYILLEEDNCYIVISSKTNDDEIELETDFVLGEYSKKIDKHDLIHALNRVNDLYKIQEELISESFDKEELELEKSTAMRKIYKLLGKCIMMNCCFSLVIMFLITKGISSVVFAVINFLISIIFVIISNKVTRRTIDKLDNINLIVKDCELKLDKIDKAIFRRKTLQDKFDYEIGLFKNVIAELKKEPIIFAIEDSKKIEQIEYLDYSNPVDIVNVKQDKMSYQGIGGIKRNLILRK